EGNHGILVNEPIWSVDEDKPSFTLAKKGDSILYNNYNASEGIQSVLDTAGAGDIVHIYNGTYNVWNKLMIRSGTIVQGQYNSTVLDYTSIGTFDTLELESGAQLRNIKLRGSIDPLPTALTQYTRT